MTLWRWVVPGPLLAQSSITLQSNTRGRTPKSYVIYRYTVTRYKYLGLYLLYGIRGIQNMVTCARGNVCDRAKRFDVAADSAACLGHTRLLRVFPRIALYYYILYTWSDIYKKKTCACSTLRF